MIVDKEWRDKVFNLLPWAQFITQDEDGDVVAWAEKPERCNSSDWYSSGDESFLGKYLVEGEWEEMMFERDTPLAEGYGIREDEPSEWDITKNGDMYVTFYGAMNYTKAQAIEAFNRMVGHD